MNLPPDKARLLRQYDNEKKWDLICDQVQVGKSREVGSCIWLDKMAATLRASSAALTRAWPQTMLIFCSKETYNRADRPSSHTGLS